MFDDVEKSIQQLAQKIRNLPELTPDEALKYTQAVLNLAHAKNILKAAQ